VIEFSRPSFYAQSMSRLLTIAMLIAVVQAQPASACAPPLNLPKTAEETAAEAKKHRQDLLDWGRNSEAIVHIRAISSSGYGESSAVIKVLKTLRGKIRRGTILHLKTIDTGMCGWGDLKRGQRGIIILDKERPRYFKGFLDDYLMGEFRKEGVLPREN
jgi:hypothetical protein